MKINFGAKICEYDAPMTVYDAAREAELVDRSIIAAKVNGEVVALTTLVEADANVELLSFAHKDGMHVFRHTASHILAQAVKRLYPETKLTIGPAIENGFYYDFDSEVTFSPDILKKIEDEMKKIVKENHKIERFELPREQAIAFMTEKNEPYKVQLIEELPE
ncbi:MAG: threonine--tRNA ligase, partial [Clostridia bacterium]|nr:threonine--tRNA ligase [Clostridia bacterium]